MGSHAFHFFSINIDSEEEEETKTTKSWVKSGGSVGSERRRIRISFLEIDQYVVKLWVMLSPFPLVKACCCLSQIHHKSSALLVLLILGINPWKSNLFATCVLRMNIWNKHDLHYRFGPHTTHSSEIGEEFERFHCRRRRESASAADCTFHLLIFTYR